MKKRLDDPGWGERARGPQGRDCGTRRAGVEMQRADDLIVGHALVVERLADPGGDRSEGQVEDQVARAGAVIEDRW
jgi:Rad3-related DNA helicase